MGIVTVLKYSDLKPYETLPSAWNTADLSGHRVHHRKLLLLPTSTRVKPLRTTSTPLVQRANLPPWQTVSLPFAQATLCQRL